MKYFGWAGAPSLRVWFMQGWVLGLAFSPSPTSYQFRNRQRFSVILNPRFLRVKDLNPCSAQTTL
jgi:hypothetical protein